MVELAHAAGMALIAEGVETEDQKRLLLENGADFIQGYFYSKPLPAEDLANRLDNF